MWKTPRPSGPRVLLCPHPTPLCTSFSRNEGEGGRPSGGRGRQPEGPLPRRPTDRQTEGEIGTCEPLPRNRRPPTLGSRGPRGRPRPSHRYPRSRDRDKDDRRTSTTAARWSRKSKRSRKTDSYSHPYLHRESPQDPRGGRRAERTPYSSPRREISHPLHTLVREGRTSAFQGLVPLPFLGRGLGRSPEGSDGSHRREVASPSFRLNPPTTVRNDWFR